MKAIFYKIQLAIHLAVFALHYALNVSHKTKLLIVTGFTLGFFFVSIGIFLLSQQTKTPETITIQGNKPTQDVLFTQHTFSSAEIQTEIIFWEKALDIQPKSRDILLTLTHLYSVIGNENIALEYQKKASAIDPNNPIF